MSDFERVRVRVAPSPTGDPHVGTAYIALFNHALARHSDGDFILRIEDTDRVRSRASSEQMIIESLKWLGLTWDEGPDVGGDYGPYRQSERADIYQKHTAMLVDKGAAYPCFCTADRLTEMRDEQKAAGIKPGYDRHCRGLSPQDVEAKKAEGLPFVVRFAMPTDGVTTFVDELRGEIEISTEQIDDQVLQKSDGFPTYHLANVVDDHLMKISHVIRAEEWISSTPKHVRLYEAFGWPTPKFVHMPLLRNNDKSKISKRKNPVSLAFYQRAGILPRALVNFLSLMGYSFGDDVEIYSLDELITGFDIKKINLGGPIFDQTKLNWLNSQYLQKMSDDEFVEFVRENVFSDQVLRAVKPLLCERIERFDQFVDRGQFFFNGGLDYSQIDLIPKGMEKTDIRKMARDLADRLDEVYEWDKDSLDAALASHKNELGWKPRDYFMTIRLIVTGRKDSPPLTDSMAVLGREIVRFRLRDAVNSVLK